MASAALISSDVIITNISVLAIIHLQREDRIKAHFLICFIALLIYRLLEKKLDEKYTFTEIIDTLREYKIKKINDEGFEPEYTRSKIIDHLHKVFGISTDYEINKPSTIRKIIKETKNGK